MKEKKDKRELLVDAAIEIIKEKGFEKASVSQIVNRAGVAQGTFYLYFQSKNEVVPYIAQKIFNDQLERIKSSDLKESNSVQEFVSMLVDVTYCVTKEYKELINFCYSGLAYYHSFERWEEIYKPYYSYLEERLESFTERGEIRTENEIPYLANYIVGIVEHGAESFYLSGKKDSLEKSKNELEKLLIKVLL
jgi:AcrR family transcriptional regulator